MNNIFYLPSYIFRFITAPLASLLVVFGLFACSNPSRTANKLAQDTSSVQNFENNLSFNDITLEQANEQGRIVWKVKAQQAIYSKDKKVAQVQNPTGELFQDGKVVYQISAQQGEIKQDGKQLFLEGQIVAKDPRTNLILRGNELEWRPQEDLLIVRNQLTGTHPQMRAVAQEARAFSRKQIVELQGRVVAIATDPVLQLRTEHLIWQMPAQKVISDRPVEIDRYKDKKVTDKATANQGEVNLKTKIVTLQQNAQLTSLDPPLQVASNHLNWNLNTEILTANQPVKIVDRQQQMTVTAKQGRMDLQKEIVYLNGDVYGIGQRRQTLNSKALTWHLPTQQVEAEGDVVYRQVEPPASFTGQKAVGKLQDQTVVVSGGRVVTEIIP